MIFFSSNSDTCRIYGLEANDAGMEASTYCECLDLTQHIPVCVPRQSHTRYQAAHMDGDWYLLIWLPLGKNLMATCSCCCLSKASCTKLQGKIPS